MKSMKRHSWLALAACLAIAAPLSACATTSPPADNVGTDLVSQIKQRGELRVAVTSAPPAMINEVGTDNWSGIFLEPEQIWADELGVKLTPVVLDYGDMVPALLAGKIDMGTNLSITEERKNAIDFSDPLYSQVDTYAVASGIDSFDKLNTSSNIVCVQAGTFQDEGLTNLAGRNFDLLRLGSTAECTVALLSDRVQGFFYSWTIIGGMVAENRATADLNVIVPPVALAFNAVAFGFVKDDDQSGIESFNKVLNHWLDEGGLAAANKNYGVANPLAQVVGDIPQYMVDMAKVRGYELP